MQLLINSGYNIVSYQSATIIFSICLSIVIINSVNLKNIRSLKYPIGPVKWSAVVISLHTDRLADEEDMVKSIVSRMSWKRLEAPTFVSHCVHFGNCISAFNLEIKLLSLKVIKRKTLNYKMKAISSTKCLKFFHYILIGDWSKFLLLART